LRAGDENARVRLAESALPLAFHLARRKSLQIGRHLLHDLVAEANLTVAALSRSFDPDSPHPFGVHAYFQIRQALTRATGLFVRPLRVPYAVQRLERSEREVRRDLRQRLRREPRRFEIARELGVSLAKLECVPGSVFLASDLDAPDAAPVPDTGPSPEDETIREDEATRIRDAVDRLGPRDRDLVGRWFGLDTHAPHTCAEIGRAEGITRQAARERCHAALRRLARVLRRRARACSASGGHA
jgi:RNA polymerase sigma factor (sigma-70 family)